MSWRDQLRKASFRGVEAFHGSADDDRGRRLAVQEYPKRDEADVEDMGRGVRRYRISLYILASVLGDGYWSRRDELIEAFEAPGPGTLVHPYYGPLEVHCESAAPRYSTSEGGRVSFDCTFIEARAPQQPKASARTDALMRSHSDALLEQVNQDFIKQWAVDQLPEFVRDAARTTLDVARRTMAIREDVFNAQISARLGLASSLNDAQAVFDALALGRDVLAALGLARIREARDFSSSQTPVRATTPSTRAQADNQAAVGDVVDAVALAAAADVVSRTVFESVDDAIAARDELLDEIDTQSLDASDGVFVRLAELRGALVEDIRARGAGLPNVRTIVPATTEPAVVIAYRQYGDATRAADIVARNRIEHPGFVPGGEPLEVLTDAA